jgi:hypothetical protein
LGIIYLAYFLILFLEVILICCYYGTNYQSHGLKQEKFMIPHGLLTLSLEELLMTMVSLLYLNQEVAKAVLPLAVTELEDKEQKQARCLKSRLG